jgi:hypothetical protein
MNNQRFRWGIREKLTLLFFGVTLIAVSVNFLMVVPRLDARLRNDRVKAMERTAERFAPQFNQWAYLNDQQLTAPIDVVWDSQITPAAAASGNRVALLRFTNPASPLDPPFTVFDDPTGETRNTVPAQSGSYTGIFDPIALHAVENNKMAAGDRKSVV